MNGITLLIAINGSLQDRELAARHVGRTADIMGVDRKNTKVVTTIQSYRDYSRFCIEDLADCFSTEFVLVLQLDSCVMNPNAWSDDFMKYDYIGAPWKMGDKDWLPPRLVKMGKDRFDKNLYVGNGGFSLRSKRLCQAVRDCQVAWDGRNEDSNICIRMRDELERCGMVFAPYTVARRFSVEHDVFEEQFGVHKRFFDKNGKQVSVSSLVVQENT